MLNEIDITRDVAQRFESAGIPYMLTGSMAMNFYAQPRMTRDVDFVVKIAAVDVPTVLQVFQNDYYISPEAVRSSVIHRSLFNAIHNESVIKVDCVIQKDSPYRRLEFERRRQVEVKSDLIWIVSKEDLIVSKLFWANDSNSELQQRDVKNLVATGCDYAYIDKWAAELGLSAIWERNK
ncbi:MAG TPA: hypothetical protein VF773_00870 [Verrucomicrobiae bacterium]